MLGVWFFTQHPPGFKVHYTPDKGAFASLSPGRLSSHCAQWVIPPLIEMAATLPKGGAKSRQSRRVGWRGENIRTFDSRQQAAITASFTLVFAGPL